MQSMKEPQASRPSIEWVDCQVLSEGLRFPEGPVAMADGSVILVEMLGGALSRVPAGGGAAEVVADCGGGPNGAAIGPDGGMYVCNNGGEYQMIDGRLHRVGDIGGQIQHVDIRSGAVTTLYDQCDGRPLLAPNDLVFDTSGGFWFTDHGRATDRGREYGGIFYAAADGSRISEVVRNVPDPNGISLSPDGSVLYWAETAQKWVKRRRIHAPGQLVRMRRSDPWATVAALPGTLRFDSMAVDAVGRLCVGALQPGGICVIDPDDGSYEMHVAPPHLDEDYVTNICFGGDDMRTAYLTCSLTQRLVSCRWPCQGLTLAFNA